MTPAAPESEPASALRTEMDDRPPQRFFFLWRLARMRFFRLCFAIFLRFLFLPHGMLLSFGWAGPIEFRSRFYNLSATYLR